MPFGVPAVSPECFGPVANVMSSKLICAWMDGNWLYHAVNVSLPD